MRLVFGHNFWFFSMTAWDVGAMPLNVHAKLEHNEDLTLLI
jgi:hypothetical protein